MNNIKELDVKDLEIEEIKSLIKENKNKLIIRNLGELNIKDLKIEEVKSLIEEIKNCFVVIISDSLWNNFGFGEPSERFKNKKWISYCLSISSLGKKLLGCEVDFQIHSKTHVENIHHNDPRCEIGI